ncbi:MAG: phospholipid methyltransferase [Chitinophagales bacterium]|nr:MAG: phospholipid methyltransferase [Chitinophagales bacterium]
MRLYDKYVLPRLVHFVCSLKPAMQQREKLIPQARGRVVEIAAGSGLNFRYYNPAAVSHLWALDSSAEMLRLAEKQPAQVKPELIQANADCLPLDDQCADTVVITYSLCSIKNDLASLNEIRRILKPGGRLLFCEHGLAPDRNVSRLQHLINPVWKRLSGGCHLNKDIPTLLKQSGFHMERLTAGYISGWRPACFNYLGSAKLR